MKAVKLKFLSQMKMVLENYAVGEEIYLLDIIKIEKLLWKLLIMKDIYILKMLNLIYNNFIIVRNNRQKW